jgi:hypothetical protein
MGETKEKKEVKELYYFNTGKTSDISRQLAFAGFAVIWIFKDTNLKVPNELIIPGIFLGITLLLDIFQYFFLGTAWWIVYKWISKCEQTWISYCGWIFYVLKIMSLIVAYFYIIFWLISNYKQ